MEKQLKNLHNLNHWCWHNPFSYLIYLIYVTLLGSIYYTTNKEGLEMILERNDTIL